MFFHPKNLKSENNNPWLKPWFNILLHTQSIVCATADTQSLEKVLGIYNFVWKAKKDPYTKLRQAFMYVSMNQGTQIYLCSDLI